MIIAPSLYLALYTIVFLMMAVNGISMVLRGKFLLTIGFGIGRSMEPAIPGGVTMTIEYYPYNLEEGDVISFKHDGDYICHRIVDISDRGTYYYTKGDNNHFDDPRVHKSDIRSKIWQPFGHVLYIPLSPYAVKYSIDKVISYVR